MFPEGTAYCQEIAREQMKRSKQAVTREKIKVTASNIEPEIVKPLTLSLEKSVGTTKSQTDNVKSGTLEKSSQCSGRMEHSKTCKQ